MSAKAKETTTHRVDIVISLSQDGSADITENWDIDRSLEEKAGKCGIVDKGDGSYELCWGIGSGVGR